MLSKDNITKYVILRLLYPQLINQIFKHLSKLHHLITVSNYFLSFSTTLHLVNTFLPGHVTVKTFFICSQLERLNSHAMYNK